MKVPEPRKLSSGNYFIQLRLNGVSVPVTAPTAKECRQQAALIKAEHQAGKRASKPSELTLKEAVDKYIDERRNVLSPSTIRGYNTIRDNRFQTVMDFKINDIKNWQKICNDEARLCSPKTLTNSWRFIASVLRSADMPVPVVHLPQITPTERPYLEPDQLAPFIKAVHGTDCEIPALLALHSLRRSEILALTWDKVDLKNKRIQVSGAAVIDENQKLVKKAQNKNAASTRYVPIMINELYDALSSAPDKTGGVVKCNHNTIWAQINRVCKKAGLPEIGVHGLRHSFATLAYHLNVPEKVAMHIGGWSDPGTMHKIYTHLSKKDISKYETQLTAFFKSSE